MYSVSSNEDIKEAGSDYIANRKRWSKPQAMIWSRTPGVVVKSGENTGLVSPTGEEGTNFIVISDHNRSPISMDQRRLESRTRMVSGNMRSYYTDDKVMLSTSWNMLPSRAYQTEMVLGPDGKPEPTEETSPFSQAPYNANPPNSGFTADGGAGGTDMLQWYYDTIGPMWVFLAYDRFDNTEGPNQFGMYCNYVERMKMFFSSFNYSVEKRGISDFWNVSVTLEEA